MFIVLLARSTSSRELLTSSLISEYLSMADRAGAPWERLRLNVLQRNDKENSVVGQISLQKNQAWDKAADFVLLSNSN